MPHSGSLFATSFEILREAVHERRAEDKGQQELQQEAKETQDRGIDDGLYIH